VASVLLFMGKRADRMAEQLGADKFAEQRHRPSSLLAPRVVV
jgi:hypothetical protein